MISYSVSPETVEVMFAQRLMAQRLLEVMCLGACVCVSGCGSP